MMRNVENLPVVEGLVRGKVREYTDPRAGWSVPYSNDRGLTVTVYVYPCPEDGAGLGSEALATAEFNRAIEEIHMAVERGAYQQVERAKVNLSRLRPSDINESLLHESFIMRTAEGPMFSELVLGVFEGKFIKFRASYPPYPPVREREQARDIHRLLAALLHGAGNDEP